MKSMKKTLALVLAVVLALGVMGAAVSAKTLSDFPDADKFDDSYKVAAEVMIGLGIIEGDENGVRPADTITRAEACKIICFILLGSEASELEGMEAETRYIDVPANEWYSMYVAYCTEKKIVSGDNGDGTGTFRPEDKITGYEFGKMCLTAIGYDSEYEGFESGIWQLEIKGLAGEVGTSANLQSDFSWPAYITRQEAFQMAFDAMQKQGVIKRTDGSGKCTGYMAEKRDPILSASYKTFTAEGPITYNEAKNCFEVGGVKVEDVSLDTVGANAKVFYQVNNKNEKIAITGTFLNIKLLATSTEGYTMVQLFDKKKDTFCGYEKDGDGVIYNLNGKAVDSINPMVGDEVNLCDTDGDKLVDFVFMQTYKAYKVTGDVTVSNKVVKVPGVDELADGRPVENVYGYDSIKKGDYVMVYRFMDGAYYELYKLSGARTLKLTKLGSNDPEKPYFGNVAYKYSSGCCYNVTGHQAPGTADLNTSYVIYLDRNGYIACITTSDSAQTTPEVVERYGILIAYQANGYKDASSGSFGDSTAEVKAVEQAIIYSFNDKNFKTYDFALTTANGKTTFVAVDNSKKFLFAQVNGTGLTSATGSSAEDYMNMAQPNNYLVEAGSETGRCVYLVKYVLNDNGKITDISVVTTTTENNVNLEKGKATKLGSEYLSSSYKYFYINRDPNKTTSFTIAAYTGYTNAPTANGVTVYYTNNEDIVVVDTLAAEEGEPDPDVVEVFIRDVDRYETTKSGTKYLLTLKAYVNGVAQNIQVEDADGQIGDINRGFYKATVNSNGIYSLTSFIGPVDKDITAKEDTFFVYQGGTPIYFNSSTKFYMVTDEVSADGTLTSVALESTPFAKYPNSTYTILRVVAKNDTATQVYYTIKAAN